MVHSVPLNTPCCRVGDYDLVTQHPFKHITLVLRAHNAIGLGLVSTAQCLRGHLCSGQPQRELDLAKNVRAPPDLTGTWQGPPGDIDLGI